VEIAAIVKAMWESLGRNAGEVPHLRHLVRNIGQSGARVSVTGMENITHSPDERPMLFFSGHIANWEVLLRGVAELGFVASPVFRHPNNPYLVRLLTRIRQIPGVELVPKGTEGARIAIKVLSSGRRLIMLADQKLNNGIAVPFFGRDAMTAPALARFGLRFDCPIIPLRIERTQGAYFHLTIQAPLELPKDGASGDPIEKIMSDVNKSLESWIRDRPAQWLWLHNRWPV
jgi:KDO2-lipid IV(A) lauroyltransferase